MDKYNLKSIMAKFKGKYKGGSRRMPHWDYSGDGLYFLTIVTQGRKCILGDIQDKKMILSDFGKIVATEWNKSFEIRDELILHEYVIMPNHIHCIVEIDTKNDSGGDIVESYGRTILQYPDSTNNPDLSDNLKTIKCNMPVRLPKSISSFIAGFKSSVNSKIDDYIDNHQLDIPKYNKNNHFFQPNYHDHIIRNDGEYQRIKRYIINNPENWNRDKLND